MRCDLHAKSRDQGISKAGAGAGAGASGRSFRLHPWTDLWVSRREITSSGERQCVSYNFIVRPQQAMVNLTLSFPSFVRLWLTWSRSKQDTNTNKPPPSDFLLSIKQDQTIPTREALRPTQSAGLSGKLSPLRPLFLGQTNVRCLWHNIKHIACPKHNRQLRRPDNHHR